MAETQNTGMSAATADPAEQALFELCDRTDDEMVIAELSGRVVDTYVYDFSQDGKVITGLTVPGVNWACREYAKHGEAIRIVSRPEPIVCPIDPEYVLTTVLAQRFAVNPETGRETALDSHLGSKRQWTKMEKKVWKNGVVVGTEIVPDKFWWEKLVAKASRNALKSCIPEDFVRDITKKALALKDKSRAAGSGTPSGGAPAGRRPAPAAAKAAAATPDAQKPPQEPKQTPAAASTPPQQPRPAAEKPQPTSQAASNVLAMRSKFWMVLRDAVGVKDEAALRNWLKLLTSKDRVSDLDEGTMMKLGPLLRAVVNKQATIQTIDGRTVVLNSDAMPVWPEDFSPAPQETAPAAPPAATPPPPAPEPGPDEQLF